MGAVRIKVTPSAAGWRPSQAHTHYAAKTRSCRPAVLTSTQMDDSLGVDGAVSTVGRRGTQGMAGRHRQMV
jgi:hypothetical protein